MIRAAKNAPGEWLVWRLIHSAVVKQFSAVHLRIHDSGYGAHGIATEATENSLSSVASRDLRVPSASPTIYYASHSSWWDGYLCMVLARLGVQRNPYLMMDEKNLARYRFFTWAGVYGVDRDDARAAIASINYAANLLQAEPAQHLPTGMFIFPQGTITPNDRRPLHLYSGAARLALKVAAHQPVRLVPVAFRYEYLQEQRSDAFISVGPGLVLGAGGDHGEAPRQTPRDLTIVMTQALTVELDALRDDIIAEHMADFTTVLRGARGIDRIFDQAASRGRRESRRLSREAEQAL